MFFGEPNVVIKGESAKEVSPNQLIGCAMWRAYIIRSGESTVITVGLHVTVKLHLHHSVYCNLLYLHNGLSARPLE